MSLRLAWLWLCCALSLLALQITALSILIKVLLSLFALAYCAHAHLKIVREPAQRFSAVRNGRLVFKQGECWQLIELTQYRRWPFAIWFEFREATTQHAAFIFTINLTPAARRALNLAVAFGQCSPKKLPAILTNPVL